ncbi:MAG: hypothetical protein ISR58_17335 [Anaerolineales bacterium]|nr:hypothetical protein [Chloroflexota bacterium]MBL6982940.1 hypothetical protein [Anaerolineales bacterium]
MMWNRTIYRAALIILLLLILISVMTAFAAVNVVPSTRLDDNFYLITLEVEAPYTQTNFTVDNGNKFISIDITNESGSQSQIVSVDITWPSDNGSLKEILFGNQQIFDNEVSPTSVIIPTDSPWKEGKEAERLIDDGETKTLEFKFNSGAESSGYYIIVTFSDDYYIIIDE